VRARARAAVLGAFVADAATMPLHWIYDVQRIQQLVGDAAPTFYHPPSCPYYDVRYTAVVSSPAPTVPFASTPSRAPTPPPGKDASQLLCGGPTA
jgi:hypothetical protein